MDVLAVRAATLRALSRARAGDGPSFLVCTTYRFGGHHVGDKQDYKDSEEARMWRARDPILRLARRLQDDGIATAETISGMEADVEAQVRAAVETAKSAPMPAAEDLRSELYA
jgi:pyruvate dehydrogenase E1 component alpha subunit